MQGRIRRLGVVLGIVFSPMDYRVFAEKLSCFRRWIIVFSPRNMLWLTEMSNCRVFAEQLSCFRR